MDALSDLKERLKPLRDAVETSPAARLAFFPGRYFLGRSYLRPRTSQFWRWLFSSRERANFTYAITHRNEEHIAHMLAVALGTDPETLVAYMQEAKSDAPLREHILSATRNSPRRRVADMRVQFGRRLGWYAAVRHMKPRAVVETGVEKGLGGTLLCAALKRNAEDGHPGRYFGTDIDRRAGYLLSGEYAKHGEILFGDSIQSLQKLQGPVDLFINDSDHSGQYERKEYDVIAPLLSERALIISDNAHVSDSLMDFAKKTGRAFLFLKEDPDGHWYPGAGLGLAFRR